MPVTPDLLEPLDEAIAALVRLRSALVAQLPATEGNGLDDTGDLVPDNLLDTTAAAARFNRPIDTIRFWCRQGCGIKVGGVWMASVPRIHRRLKRE